MRSASSHKHQREVLRGIVFQNTVTSSFVVGVRLSADLRDHRAMVARPGRSWNRRTSGVRTGGQTPCGPDVRPSTRRGTESARARSVSSGPRAGRPSTRSAARPSGSSVSGAGPRPRSGGSRPRRGRAVRTPAHAARESAHAWIMAHRRQALRRGRRRPAAIVSTTNHHGGHRAHGGSHAEGCGPDRAVGPDGPGDARRARARRVMNRVRARRASPGHRRPGQPGRPRPQRDPRHTRDASALCVSLCS